MASKKDILSHDFVVRCIPVHSDDTHMRICIEYISGGTSVLDIGGTQLSVGTRRRHMDTGTQVELGNSWGFTQFMTREQALQCAKNNELLVVARVRVNHFSNLDIGNRPVEVSRPSARRSQKSKKGGK